MSRKYAVAFFVFLLLFLTACRPKLPPPPPRSFTAQAQITFGEKRFTAALEQSCPGSLRLDFAGLPELEGMQLRLEGGTAILRYGGMELSLPTPSLPQAGFAGLLSRALQQLAQPAEGAVKRVPGGWDVNGAAGGLAYTVRVDTEGMPRALDMPGTGLHIELLP
ncbi:MAG: hypothetical protein FWC27_09200 [Firmicutes bacterium]|nr:hypothetical protein [Bacillota bacterium]